jgi:tetratricopeptide (TPR) repeat protein
MGRWRDVLLVGAGRMARREGRVDRLGLLAGLLALCFAAPAAAQAPATVDELYNLGWVAIQEERYDEAITLYRQVVAKSPTYKEAWYNLGHAHSFKKQYDEEIAAYEKAIELDSNYFKALASLSYAHSDKGNQRQVVQYGERAVALDPDAYEGYFHLGYATYHIALEQASIEERDAMMHRAMAYDIRHITDTPDSAKCWVNVAVACDHIGDDRGAIGAYRKAIAIQPDYPKALYNLGLSLDKVGDAAAALEIWKAYLAVAEPLPDEAEFVPYARERIAALGGSVP